MMKVRFRPRKYYALRNSIYWHKRAIITKTVFARRCNYIEKRYFEVESLRLY